MRGDRVARAWTRSCSTSGPVCASGAAPCPPDGSFRGTALVTHLHWDHVQGLPFFAPINCPGARLDIYAPRPSDAESVGDAFEEFMRPPYFPVRATDLFGDITFHDAPAGEMTIGPATVKVRRRAPRRRDQRLPGRGRRRVDRLHQRPPAAARRRRRRRRRCIELCRDADLVIHDAQFLPDEFAVKTQLGPLHRRVRRARGGRGRAPGAWRCSTTTPPATTTPSTRCSSTPGRSAPSAASTRWSPRPRASPSRFRRAVDAALASQRANGAATDRAPTLGARGRRHRAPNLRDP